MLHAVTTICIVSPQMRWLTVTLILGVPVDSSKLLLRIAAIQLVTDHTQLKAVTPAPIATVVTIEATIQFIFSLFITVYSLSIAYVACSDNHLHRFSTDEMVECYSAFGCTSGFFKATVESCCNSAGDRSYSVEGSDTCTDCYSGNYNYYRRLYSLFLVYLSLYTILASQ